MTMASAQLRLSESRLKKARFCCPAISFMVFCNVLMSSGVVISAAVRLFVPLPFGAVRAARIMCFAIVMIVSRLNSSSVCMSFE